MSLERRVLLVHHIGTQYARYGQWFCPDALRQHVEALTVADLQRVGYSLLRSEPTYCVFGSPDDAAAHSSVQQVFADVRAVLDGQNPDEEAWKKAYAKEAWEKAYGKEGAGDTGDLAGITARISEGQGWGLAVAVRVAVVGGCVGVMKVMGWGPFAPFAA